MILLVISKVQKRDVLNPHRFLCTVQDSLRCSTSSDQADDNNFPPSLQAMLFHWAPSQPLKPGGTLSKPLPTLSYWVCGRVIRNPLSSASSSPGATPFKEFYVAYHQSAPQNMVELAFRLAFGIHM